MRQRLRNKRRITSRRKKINVENLGDCHNGIAIEDGSEHCRAMGKNVITGIVMLNGRNHCVKTPQAGWHVG